MNGSGVDARHHPNSADQIVQFPHDETAEATVTDKLKNINGRSSSSILAPDGAQRNGLRTDIGMVAQALAMEGFTPLINFGPGEEALARTVETSSNGAARAISCSLAELIALTRRASLFIGGDTGPLHLAAALRSLSWRSSVPPIPPATGLRRTQHCSAESRKQNFPIAHQHSRSRLASDHRRRSADRGTSPAGGRECLAGAKSPGAFVSHSDFSLPQCSCGLLIPLSGRSCSEVGIAITGLLIRALASGHVQKNEELATSGPYAYTRNPLYLGSLIMAGGFALASRSWIVVAIAVLMLLAIYIPVIRSEEEFLRARFPEFEDYCR